jgi:hypothetical protein
MPFSIFYNIIKRPKNGISLNEDIKKIIDEHVLSVKNKT